MSQDTILPESNHDKLVLLADVAWKLLASHPIDQIEFDAVADMAGVNRRLAAALGGSVQCLVLAKMTALDHQSVIETYDDIEDAGDVTIREKIIERLLHRFETYAPYRSQIEQLYQSARRHPGLAFLLLDGLEAVVRRILLMSGDPVKGMKGMLRIKGVAGVFLIVSRVWMTDDSDDLAATMKLLDQQMSKAEEWGISLQLFGVVVQNDHMSDDHMQEDDCYEKDNE